MHTHHQTPPHGYQSCGSFNPQMVHHYLNKYQGFMPYDLEEEEETYFVTMPLPGFETKEIEVSVSGSEILIEARHEKSPESSEEKSPRKVVSMGHYLWNRPIKVKIPVEEEIDPAKVKARLKRGLLKVEFPKLPKQTVPVEETE